MRKRLLLIGLPILCLLITACTGGRMTVEFADVSGEIEVGAQMRMVFRIKAVDEVRGMVKYFWKAAPAR